MLILERPPNPGIGAPSARNVQPETRRTFAMDAIASVGIAEAHNVIVLRTRTDDRIACLWMSSADC